MRPSLWMLLFLCLPVPAYAYIGPGAGLGTIVVTLALVLGLLLLAAGFLWYPIKRMMQGRKSRSEGKAGTSIED